MNAGVCTTPCAVVISPARAAPSLAVRRKQKAISRVLWGANVRAAIPFR
jgi:hypothetical protein